MILGVVTSSLTASEFTEHIDVLLEKTRCSVAE